MIDTHVALERAYAAVPQRDAANYRYAFKEFHEVCVALVDRFHDLRGKKIVDLGAGRGILCLTMKFLGAEVTAVEKYVFDHTESEMFHEGGEAELLSAWTAAGVRHVRCDIKDVAQALAGEVFDAVVSTEVIEHLKSPKVFLDDIQRLLKPGGIAVITTPNYGRLQARLRLLFGHNPKIDLERFYDLGEGFIGHWREYLPEELAWMCRRSGLRIIRQKTFSDVWFGLKKHVSFFSIKQSLLLALGSLIPNARFTILVVAEK